MGEVDRTPERGSQQQGELIVRVNVIGTVIFVATSVFAAAVFTTTAQWVGASTAMALFAVGVFAFLWGFWNAVQRSRDEEVSVTQLYMLLGAGTPKEVRRTMLLMLGLQVAAAFGTAVWRIDGPDGSLITRCWPPRAHVWDRLEWPVGCLSRRIREEDGPRSGCSKNTN